MRLPSLPSAALRAASSLLLVAAAGCAVNPATGRREFSLVSAGQELTIGREGYTATVAEYGAYGDSTLAKYVDGVGQRVARASDLPDLEWHFTVLDDPMVNAFAMPGGYIYITRGILSHLESEAQLAGVLGHEIGHVTARHTARQITQQQIAGLGMVVAGAISPTFQRYSGPAQQALGLLMLKYSRDDETQADELGVRYATAAGYDPREIPSTYAMLKRVSAAAGGSLPFYLSTHPDPGNREQRTTELAAQAVYGKGRLEVGGHVLLDHVRGIVYGDDPRLGWVDGRRFSAPQSGFEMDLPGGWTVQRSRSALVAAAPAQAGALQVTLATDAGTRPPADYVAALRAEGRIADANGYRETVGGWPAWVGRVAAPANNAPSTVLAAAWVRPGPERLVQVLGRSAALGDSAELAILASARSLRPIDARRAHPEPDRVRVVPAPAAGAFRDVLPRLGPSALGVDETSIVNGLLPDAKVAAGQWLKIVEPGRGR